MRNWKTTIVGLIGAIAIAIQPYLESGAFDTKALITAAVVAAFGVIAKDFNVSGPKA